MNRDAIIIAGMLLCIAVAIFMLVRARLIFTRLVFLVSAVATCVGLAYFGWQPLFGGTHLPDTFFGAVMLCLGVFGFCLSGAIEEIWRRINAPPDPAAAFQSSHRSRCATRNRNLCRGRYCGPPQTSP